MTYKVYLEKIQESTRQIKLKIQENTKQIKLKIGGTIQYKTRITKIPIHARIKVSIVSPKKLCCGKTMFIHLWKVGNVFPR